MIWATVLAITHSKRVSRLVDLPIAMCCTRFWCICICICCTYSASLISLSMFTEKSLALHDIFQNLMHTQVHCSKNQMLYTTRSLYQIAIFMYMFKNRLLPLVYSNFFTELRLVQYNWSAAKQSYRLLRVRTSYGKFNVRFQLPVGF